MPGVPSAKPHADARPGCESFVTEAEKVCRAVSCQPLIGYTELRYSDFTVPGGPMRAMVYRGPYKIRVEEKTFPRWSTPTTQLSR